MAEAVTSTVIAYQDQQAQQDSAVTLNIHTRAPLTRDEGAGILRCTAPLAVSSLMALLEAI